jgi:hypothetical protein
VDIERTMEFILEMQAKTEAGLARTEALAERNAREIDQLEAILRRAIRAGVREALAERRKRREVAARAQESADRLQDAMAQLAAAQRVTEEKMQLFLDSMRRGGNGHS